MNPLNDEIPMIMLFRDKTAEKVAITLKFAYSSSPPYDPKIFVELLEFFSIIGNFDTRVQTKDIGKRKCRTKTRM